MKTLFKVLILVIVVALVGIVVRPFIFRSEETGPVYAEAISDDGMLKLTMMLEETKFTVSPREPVRINFTLTNIGNEDITITFHYKTKFDFMVWSYSEGCYMCKWSYEHIEGPSGWSPNPSSYPINITLEKPEIDTIALKPGEKISQTLTWNQNFNGWQGFAGGEGYYQVQPAAKGKYRIDGFAGFARWPDSPENPQRFFEYVLPDGTLVSAVLQTPGIDISLV